MIFSMRPRLSRIYYAGKFYAYPLKAFEALRNLGLGAKHRLSCLLCLCPRLSGPRSEDLPSMDAQ